MNKDYCILLFSYNRPSHLKRVVISLENYKVNNLYVILDGPKNNKDKLVQKEIITNVLGENKIKIKLIKRKKNIGLAKSIYTALDNFSKKYKKIIILEDDCIPRKEFFSFIKKSFYLSLKDDGIAAICGYQLPQLHNKNLSKLKILKLKHFIPWGWAIKSKNWQYFRKNFKKVNLNYDKKDLPSNLKKILKKSKNNEKNIWSKNFVLFNYINKKFYLFPDKSLIKNIGFDGSGVNSKITDIFYTKYFKSKKISNEIIEKKKIIYKQEQDLSKLVDYYY